MIMRMVDGGDGRRTATAALRNTAPLIETLQTRLPDRGRVLEVASGTGQHAAAFAEAFPTLEWVPSDMDPAQLYSIAAWRRESGLKNLAAPVTIDVSAPWPITPGTMQAVLTINLLHLIPEPYVTHFFTGARVALDDRGQVIIYGPFMRGTDYASDGDWAFDSSLRASDPTIGYKSVEAVVEMAAKAGLTQVATDAMPANNLLLTFAAQ
ncbi:MAG: DUF938 domain-containing protein [Alphaproteobacteria bacterium]|nr:DUF938 domain-containing protein [Alphaproteobacteria bacterium SS10]